MSDWGMALHMPAGDVIIFVALQVKLCQRDEEIGRYY
jgi:hypothetical protein